MMRGNMYVVLLLVSTMSKMFTVGHITCLIFSRDRRATSPFLRHFASYGKYSRLNFPAFSRSKGAPVLLNTN